MRASSSSGERSERMDVAGEGIAKAAGGKSACFGASVNGQRLREYPVQLVGWRGRNG